MRWGRRFGRPAINWDGNDAAAAAAIGADDSS